MTSRRSIGLRSEPTTPLSGQIRSIRGFQQPGQISVGIQAVFNGCLDQAEHNGTAGGTLGGIGEQVSTPGENNVKRLEKIDANAGIESAGIPTTGCKPPVNDPPESRPAVR